MPPSLRKQQQQLLAVEDSNNDSSILFSGCNEFHPTVFCMCLHTPYQMLNFHQVYILDASPPPQGALLGAAITAIIENHNNHSSILFSGCNDFCPVVFCMCGLHYVSKRFKMHMSNTILLQFNVLNISKC